MKKIILFALALLAINFASAAGIYIGVIDGYVSYLNGSKAADVNVTVIVDNCYGEGCSGSYLTESNPSSLGYYVIGNLNIPAGGTVDVSASKGIYQGGVSNAATSNYTAMINITIAAAPGLPSMFRYSASSHNTTVRLTCVPGADYEGLTNSVDVQIDSGSVINTPLYNQTVTFSFGSHTWRCRTCNTYICSGWIYDPFTIVNNPPTTPVLVNQGDTNLTTVTLNWTSGIDPDGDLVYDEYDFDGSITSPAIPPVTETNLSQPAQYSWRVRTCDIYGSCSSWTSDTFIAYPILNNPPTEPVLVPQNDTNLTTVTLNWTSGTDPENDTTHDEFSINGHVTSPATSPIIVTNLSQGAYYTWGVRTCDSYGHCSNWVYDSFSVAGGVAPPVQPPTIIAGGACAGGAISGGVSPYTIYIDYPSYVYKEDMLTVNVLVNSTQNIGNLSFDLMTPDTTLVLIDKKVSITGKNATVSFTFSTEEGTPKNLNLRFVGYRDGTIFLLRDFSVDVRDKPPIELLREREIKYIAVPTYPLLLTFLVLTFVTVSTVIYWIYRRIIRDRNAHRFIYTKHTKH